MNVQKGLDDYFNLVSQRPEEFKDVPYLHIELNRETIEEYMKKTGKQIGIVYQNEYNIMVVDLICGPDSSHYTYQRMMQAALGEAVVCVPIYNEKFVLLRQYRHSLRDVQYAFPRGYGENGLTAEENAAKELEEEIGAALDRAERLGVVVADSGISGNRVQTILCHVKNIQTKKGYEGIDEVVMLSADEMEDWMRSGKINDGFTLSAYALFCAKFGK